MILDGTVSDKSNGECTMGANWKPHANLTVRPEVGFDWETNTIDRGTPIIGFDAVKTF